MTQLLRRRRANVEETAGNAGVGSGCRARGLRNDAIDESRGIHEPPKTEKMRADRVAGSTRLAVMSQGRELFHWIGMRNEPGCRDAHA